MSYPLPDYENCLANLSNSILKNFGVESIEPTLKIADKILDDNKHRNVVVILLDAMGISIMEKHLKPDGLLRSHLVDSYSSVFPPTTVAATTSVMSGLYPNEHGWLGWDVYFPQIDKNVAVFTNCEQHLEDPNDDSEIPKLLEPVAAADYHVGFKFCPYENIIDKINKAGGKAYFSMPFMEPFPGDIDSILKRAGDLCREPGKKFIYCYWGEPDHTMHLNGVDGKEAHDIVNEMEKKVEDFIKTIDDALVIVTADHGHMNNVNRCILDYPDITECLVRMPSIEPRTLNLFIKDEYKDSFADLFNSKFSDKFWLLTKKEVLDMKLFGKGKDHKDLSEMLGDYLAISIDDESLFVTHLEASMMPGAHAGLTKEELEIPLIAIEID